MYHKAASNLLGEQKGPIASLKRRLFVAICMREDGFGSKAPPFIMFPIFLSLRASSAPIGACGRF